MNDKEKAIEEVAKVLHDRIINKTWRPKMVAKELYEIVVPDGAVVLTGEEYERLKRIENEKDRLYEIKLDLENQLIEKGWTDYEGADEIEKRARKETAREFAERLVEKLKDNVDGQNVDFFVDVKKFAEDIAKQFGVEIEG